MAGVAQDEIPGRVEEEGEGPEVKDDREIVMARIREALQIRRVAPLGSEVPVGDLLPAVGDLEGSFRAQFKALSGEIVDGKDGVMTTLRRRHGWKRVAIHEDALVREAMGDWDPDLVWEDGADEELLEQCDVGVTSCAALVAQTGSVLLAGAHHGGRALSILPPHHVVIATRDQLVADLPAAMEMVGERCGESSLWTLHTGPSRTGDIERILVLGAHGPKRMTVVLV